MIDAVLGWHQNPLTCGVCKFNVQLSQALQVPFAKFGATSFRHPLVSIKGAEMPRWVDWPIDGPFDLFLHDADVPWVPIAKAARVFVGNTVLARAVREVRPDVIPAWCPSTVAGDPSRGAYRVLAFGFAHKVALDRFRVLKGELDQAHPDYTIALSTGVHEGSPWDIAFEETVAGMRAIFGDKLRVLGFLADDALVKELAECDAVACFYEPAFRANNTSGWAAMAAGKPLLTNVDHDSPVLDVEAHSWERLVGLLRAA